MGPAGARDFASVITDGTGASLVAGSVRGFTAVKRLDVGSYCLTPDASITSSSTFTLLVSEGIGAGGGPGFVRWEGKCSTSPLSLWVQTFDTTGSLSDGIDFTAAIP